jgi:hypothetical protein
MKNLVSSLCFFKRVNLYRYIAESKREGFVSYQSAFDGSGLLTPESSAAVREVSAGFLVLKKYDEVDGVYSAWWGCASQVEFT